MQELYLKSGEDRRISRGHPWVYSNEIDVGRSPLKGLSPGSPVQLKNAAGRLLGTGYASPNSLICLRLLSRQAELPDSLLEPRLAQALAWRERCIATPHYRWVNAEGDGLPGLIIDRYADACVVQTSTIGMEQRLPQILAAIDALVGPDVLIVKNDAGLRQMEGLPSYVEMHRGAVSQLQVVEGQAQWQVPAVDGQKTGWFYDQRDNRVRLAALYRGARVLDLYSYAGGWSIQAALAGATSVLAVDASAGAVEAVRVNAALNGVADRVDAVRSDVSQFLTQCDERYDWVILDPPSLVPRRKDLPKAQNHYRLLNRLALGRVADQGVFVSCSCSALLDEAAHLALIRAAARQSHTALSLIGRGSLPVDHPVHTMLPDSAYLKCWYFRVSHH